MVDLKYVRGSGHCGTASEVHDLIWKMSVWTRPCSPFGNNGYYVLYRAKKDLIVGKGRF